MVVDMKRFKYVTYDLDGGKEIKEIELVMSQVSVVCLKRIHPKQVLEIKDMCPFFHRKYSNIVTQP
jgi:hypothetical protein